MKKANKSLRVFALALCLMTVFTVAAPALAASIYAYGTVSADNTPVYSTAAMTTTLGVFNKNDIVAIESQVSAQNLYVVRLSGSTASVGYISKSAVSGLRYSLKSGTSVASLKTGSGTTTGTPGVIANCSSYVNFRATASASGTLLGTLSKGTALTILGTEGSFTKVTANGKTGYVSSTYVSATSTDTPSNSAGQGSDTGKITVGTGAINITPYQSTALSTVKSKLTAAQKTNSKTIGYISINGTNIQQPILFYSSSNVHYYSTHDINNKTASAGAVYAFYKDMVRNNTITGHNMRGSNAMFHQLHHIQEKTLGYTKCQTTDYACKGSSLSSMPSLTVAANRTWDVSLFGYNKWEVWAMYETPANEPASTLKYNTNPLSSYKPAQIKSWIEYQKNRSEYKFNTAISTDDIFLTVYTCGTNYDYATAQSRIYFFLKAVK